MDPLWEQHERYQWERFSENPLTSSLVTPLKNYRIAHDVDSPDIHLFEEIARVGGSMQHF
jgi:hypothetical protein